MAYRASAETLTAAFWIPRFEIQVECRRSPELEGTILVLLSAGRQPSVVACSEEAERAGLRIGMPLREVTATAPRALVQAADPYYYEAIFGRALTELEAISPLIEPDAPGLAYVSLEGLLTTTGGIGIYPNRTALVAALEGALSLPFEMRIGIARGKFIAWAAAALSPSPSKVQGPRVQEVGSAFGGHRGLKPAGCGIQNPPSRVSPNSDLPEPTKVGFVSGSRRVSTPGAAPGAPSTPGAPGPDSSTLSGSGRTRWVKAGRQGEFLVPLPVSLLPVSLKTRGKLERFGIRTLGELAEKPLSALLGQFGPEGERMWRLARGQDDAPLQPRLIPPEIAEHLNFPTPETTRETLLTAVRQLLERALKRPELQGRGVRQVRLEARLESRRVWMQTITLRRPGTRPENVFPPLRYALEREHPEEAVEALTLALTAFTRAMAGQQALFPEPEKERQARLAEELRQLRTRMGRAPVCHILEVEPWSRVPERRHSLISYDP